jgi:hypothetical protein
MKLTNIPKYRAEDGTTIEYAPVKDAPGFSHRVLINGIPVDWQGNHRKPSKKSAVYFLEKHKDNPKCKKAT